MAASLEERSSGLCFCPLRALPFFDFGDGTDACSKSSSELEDESSCCDLRFLCDGRVSVVTPDLVSELRCCPFCFLCEDLVSVVRLGEPLACGVLCAEEPPPRADLSYSSSVSSGESISGELWGFVWCSFVVVAVVLSDIERRRSPVFCVLFDCF